MDTTYDGIHQDHTLETVGAAIEHAETEIGWRAGTELAIGVSFPNGIRLFERTKVNSPDLEERIRVAAQRLINTLRRAQGEPDINVVLLEPSDAEDNVIQLVRPTSGEGEDPA